MERRFEEAHAIAADPRGEGWALHGLGYSHAGQRDFEAAIAHYRKALDTFREAGDRPGQGETLYKPRPGPPAHGRSDAARDCWIRALAIFEDLQTPPDGRRPRPPPLPGPPTVTPG